MSARRKATAAAYLGVMLKVLVIMVVAYAMDGKRPLPSKQPMFTVSDAFGGESIGQNSVEYQDPHNLRPEVAEALTSLVKSHDLNLELTVFGENMPSALGRAATVAQLLQKSGIPTSSLRVIGNWGELKGAQSTNYILVTTQ